MTKKSIAVVITVKDDAETLRRLLAAIERQSRLPDEVIITVASSTDATLKVAQDWNPGQIKTQVKEQSILTRSQGRNLGVQLARSEVIVFTDAGCLPENTWLEKLVQPFTNKDAELVSGLTWVKAKNAWEEAQAPFVLVPPTQIPAHPLPATRNMAILKQTFVKSGGFQADLNFAEDYEFARRLCQQNIRAEFVPTSVVWWQPRSTPVAFFQMIQRLTQGDMQAHTWRFGHFSMVIRYFVFLFLPIFFALWLTKLEAAGLALTIYFFYLFIKTIRFSFVNWKSYVWAPLLQLLTDLAVLIGIFQSLRMRQTKGKHHVS